MEKAGGLVLQEPTKVHLSAPVKVASTLMVTGEEPIAVKAAAAPHEGFICGQPTRASSYLWLAPSGSSWREFIWESPPLLVCK